MLSSRSRRRSMLQRAPAQYLITALAVVLLALSGAQLQAQVLYGSLVGNVTDESGAAIPGATVTVTHKETGASREAVADSTGAYRFANLQSGTYTVTVKIEGFRTFTRSDIPVTLNNVTRADAALQVGALTESVTVTGERPLLQTDRAEVRSELKAVELVNLPVALNRNYQYMFRTLPGFTPPAEAHSVPSNPSRALVFNVNGASRSSNNIRIDGVSTTNIWLPHVAAYVPALESLDTVNVVTNSFDAEQGLAGGSAINVQIKSGTNDLHGSGFEYHSNDALRTNNYFAKLNNTPKGEWTYNQFGGTLGGPVVRNRLFYFGSYEGTRDEQALTRTLSVPTAAVRQGNLAVSTLPIFDPLTGAANGSGRTAFAGNQIPAERIDATAKKLLELLPPPNLRNPDGTIPETNNYFVAAPFILNRHTLDTKVNFNATDRLNFFGRFSVLDFYTENGTNFGKELQGAALGSSNPGVGEGNTYNFSVGSTYMLSQNMVMDAHIGFVRMNTGVAQTDLDENKGLNFLGLPGTNGPNFYEGGTPWFDLDTYADFGTTDNFMPYYRSDDQVQAVFNTTWTKAGHNVRFGTDIYYQALNHTQPEISGDSFGARGGFRFGNGTTQLQGGQGGNFYNGFASFLLGLPNRIGRLKLVEPYTTRNWQYSLYVRDQWQPTGKLTLSFGTRWEYYPVPTRAGRGLERFNVDTNQMMIGGLGSVPKDLGIEVSKTMFAPRAGVVYRATQKSVLRAGFGITNDPYSLARPLRTNHPAVLNLLLDAPNSFQFYSRTADGIPLISDPDVSSGIVPVPPAITVFTLPDKFERGYIRSFNTAFQHELPWGFVGEAAYVGTRQINQLGFKELNWSPINGAQAGRQLNVKYGRTAQTRLIAPIGDSKYDALQARFDRRFRNGIQVGTTYTFSKSTGIAGNGNSDGTLMINIPEYYDLNKATSDFDRTHNLQVTSIVELPFGRGKHWLSNGGVLSAIVGGWQVSNILSFYSGTPFSVTASGASLNTAENAQRADQVKDDVEIYGFAPNEAYFDVLAFKPVTEARFGTAPFNVLRGPGVKSWDVMLARQIQFGQQAAIQLRFEAFNVTDTPRFNNPNGNVSNLQFNADGTVRALGGFGVITGTGEGSERQMRFGIRFVW